MVTHRELVRGGDAKDTNKHNNENSASAQEAQPTSQIMITQDHISEKGDNTKKIQKNTKHKKKEQQKRAPIIQTLQKAEHKNTTTPSACFFYQPRV